MDTHEDVTLDTDPMDPARFADLTSDGQSGIVGQNYGFSCSIQAADHAHVQRVGAGAHARVAVAVHDSDDVAAIYVSPAQARKIAAALLNAADEINGLTPLVFVPRFTDEENK